MATDDDIEFDSHKWVWIPDKQKTFIKGFVLEDNLDSGTKLKIRTEDDKDVIVMKDESEPVNPPKFNNADDMAELTHLNEPSVLYNLQSRYMNDMIYTYSGLFLVAVNPYATIAIYGPDYVDMYSGSKKEDTKPHIFAITELTYRYMLEKQQNQSILVTGESGAGKTENTKKIIQYLAAITSESANSSQLEHTFEDQIIQANPILESFGNAQTVRNNNSSRFGKFIRIEFSGKGKIAGANIDWYLLEKSRVVRQASNERNYHVFYQILSGLSKSEKEKWYINKSPSQFGYLAKGNTTIQGVDDKKEFRDLIHAFETMNFSAAEYQEIFKTVAIILLMGDISFIGISSDRARFSDDSPVKQLCDLLGINANEFKNVVLSPKVKAGKELVTQNKNASQAKFSIDAISKSLYERTFKLIVDKINDKLDHSLSTSNFIGVLDIAGFEIFKQNSFEQLCINYTNERLQQFFNHHMFVLEQNEYLKENINWKFIDFGQDLQETIDLIESSQKPIGILSILNEECIVPKSSDKSFISKLNSIWAPNTTKPGAKSTSKFKKSRYDNGFTIKHYAGDVDYTTDDWLDKNRDPLNQSMVDLLVKSTNQHIAGLFEDTEVPVEAGKKGKSGFFRTVAQRHKEQLSDLMTQLDNTYPHFVRCILPNNRKKPHELDKKLVLDQLRCNGVLEGIRIARAGYPNRIFFKEFYQRYKFLAKELQIFGSSNDFKNNCEIILKSIKLDEAVYKVGLTKIFFKNGILAQLEIKREAVIQEILKGFQSVLRGKLVRKRITKQLEKVQAAQVIKKNFLLYNDLKQNEWYNLMIKIKPLLDSSKQQKQKQIVMEQVSKYKEKVAELEEKNKITVSEKSDLEKQLKKLNEVLETERILLSEKDSKIQEATKREIEVSRSLETNLKEVETLRAEAGSLKKAKEAVDLKIEQITSDLAEKNKLITQYEEQKKLLADEKGRIQKELTKSNSEIEQYKRDSSAQLEMKVKSATTGLNLEVKKLQNENKDLRNQLINLKESSTKLELARSTKTRDLDTLNRTIESQKNEIDLLTKEKTRLANEHKSMSSELDKMKDECAATQARFKKLEADAIEAKNLLKIKIADDIKFDRGKQKYDNEILELKHAKRAMEKQLEEEKQKRIKLEEELESSSTNRSIGSTINGAAQNGNAPNGSDFVPDDVYNSIKLQLNEKAAMLSHESQQRQKLESEMKILQTRLASESFDNQKLSAQLRKLKRSSRIGFIQETSFNNDFLSANSSDVDLEQNLEVQNEKLSKEVHALKEELENERTSSRKSEELVMSLQKQVKGNKSAIVNRFNSMKNDDFHDIYKIKFENADAKVKKLEKQLKELRSIQPLRENINAGNLQGARKNEFANGDEDYSRRVKALKSENTRLKQMLNDALADDKYQRPDTSFDDTEADTSKEFIFQEELVTSRLRLENAQHQIDDLARQVSLYKERSEEYFDKLESAEHAVRSSKRAEKKAKQELEEVVSQLAALKKDEKAQDAQHSKMRLKINQLEAKVQSKETEIKKIKTIQQTLLEELEHYRFKLVTDTAKDSKDKKFEDLSRKLKEKLIVETELKKELRLTKMLLEDSNQERAINEETLTNWRQEKSHIVDKLTMLEANNAKYKASDRQNKKKLESLLTQVNTLHEAMDKMIDEREVILKEKKVLESKIEDLSNGHVDDDAIGIVLEQQKQEIERSRQELELVYRNQKSMKRDLMEEKEKTLLVVEENRGLESLIRELQSNLKDLKNSQSNGENGADQEFYLKRIKELEKQIEESSEHEQSFLIMERLIKDLKIKLETVEKQNDQLISENDEIKDKAEHLKDLVDELEESESQANLNYRRAERELKEQREKGMRMEMDSINWKKLGKFGRSK